MTRFACLSLAVLAVGCGGTTSTDTDGGTTDAGAATTDGGGGSGVQPTYTDISQKIFLKSCALSGCHSSQNPQEGLDLTPANAYALLVNQPTQYPSWPAQYAKRVVPGDTAHSALSACVEQPAGLNSLLYMPLGSKLPQNQIDAIDTWIKNGALKN
jgi:hypothetical protein